jgi:hypothetical protein
MAVWAWRPPCSLDPEDNDEGTRWPEFESFVVPKRNKLEIVGINCDTILSLFVEDKAKSKNLKYINVWQWGTW